jgi:hypothetical protein
MVSSAGENTEILVHEISIVDGRIYVAIGDLKLTCIHQRLDKSVGILD